MYKHIFFDLDNTLWDFETSSTQTLLKLYEKYELQGLGVEYFEEFKNCYIEYNNQLWELYRDNLIAKSDLNVTRFYSSLKDFGVNDMILAQRMANDYVATSPYSRLLMPNAIETLEALYLNYNLHIITNGFDEIQRIKLNTTGIDKYFKTIITSEMAGHKKPNAPFFEYALNASGATVDNCVVIGDDYEADIVGAINMKMSYIYYNPKRIKHDLSIKCEVNDLIELIDVLRK